MGDVAPFRLPWEPAPVDETLAALQRDVAYIVQRTCVVVHSSHPELRMAANTVRGQIVPRGECVFKDDTTIEFQDIGMPQVGLQEMGVRDLIQMVYEKAAALNLEIS